jgi:hypothetical protein
MATISIGHRPDLTKEQVQQIFAERFAGDCEVIRSNAINRDFIIKKNGWTGAGVRLMQEKNATTLVFTAIMPNVLLQTLFGGLFAYALLRKSWKEMEMQVAGFIRLAPEFQRRPLANAA